MAIDKEIKDYCNSCDYDVTQLIEDSTGKSGEVIFCPKCGKIILDTK